MFSASGTTHYISGVAEIFYIYFSKVFPLRPTTDGANSLYLIEPSAEGFKPISKADLLVDNSGAAPRGAMGNWAPMALADGMLLIRNQTTMKCVKVAK